ncbi:type IX secretion system protein PorQ [Tenuifilum thalassicum]|uniref:Type IX secretion system protein PorQ n=1 Tax=Tenuifilum thalassicum TaxID=2590900 RepID=A0A7D4BEQ1_9BACT|nr:type IX secretion system protein PorQ [Tenuifilum thalassicum]QKG80943.1 type IX secretion system protein PorQ [Tenuifilum thalassicum]
MQRYYLTSISIIIYLFSFGQGGGLSTYQFLNLPYSTQVAALGGKMVAADCKDITLVHQNPAILDSTLSHEINLFYTRYFADISFASATYAQKLDAKRTLAISFFGVNYGAFDEADVSGIITGSFTGNDIALALTYSQAIDSNFTYGVSLKTIYSHLERYYSFGAAFDIGLHYESSNNLFAAGAVIKNIGYMIKPYTNGNFEHLPFEILLGISKKLAHAPFRITATLHNLQRYNLYYSPPDNQSLLIEQTENSPGFIERAGREMLSHAILGIEFTPVKAFTLRFGYNYQRRNELKVQERIGTVGFSWGFGIHLNKFDISFGRATYHLAGSTNHFSISSNLHNWL